MKTLLTALLTRLRSSDAATAQPHAANRADDEDRPLGCGWFDSSHDLHHGLVVQEHATPDRLGGELPLRDWLALQLDACCVTQPV